MWVLILRGTYCVSVCAHCLCPASVHHGKEPASIFHLLMPSHEAFIQDIKISSKLSPVQIEQSQIFHSIVTITVTGGPELDPVCQTWPHQCFIKGKPFNFHLLLTAGSALLKEAQNIIRILCGKCTSQAHRFIYVRKITESNL